MSVGRGDPQAVTPPPLVPPGGRSRAGLRLTAAAARGVFALQQCGRCGAWLYPARDACPGCLSVDLVVNEAPSGGMVLAETTVRVTSEPFFRARAPWRVGLVALDCGPTAVVHLAASLAVPSRATVVARLDAGGNSVLVATEGGAMDDRLANELSASPKGRRVLVTDARTAVGQALVAALRDAGAVHVFAGVAEPWTPFAGREALAAPGVEAVDLDVTDSRSVALSAGAIAGKVDILVNTVDMVRPGGILGGPGAAAARQAFEANVLGLYRLAEAFGTVLSARGGDTPGARAFVDVVPVTALAPDAFAVHAATAAARRSLLASLRAELRPGGIRTLAVFTGPVDDDWRSAMPPPKVSPRALARAVVAALENGTEESFVGDVARETAARWRDDPKVLERETAP